MSDPTPRDYSRVITAAVREPWAVSQEMVVVISDLLRFRARGGRLTADEIRARIATHDLGPRLQARVVRPPAGSAEARAVSIVPIYGVIAHRTFEASSGMTSAEAISAMLARAVSDPETGAIVLDIASPGGTVAGLPELAEQVYRARKAKPIVAVANADAMSAAYWIGAMATEVVAIPSGTVGSIGVYALHEDWSKWLDQEGIAVTAIQAGRRKTEGAPWAPLDDEAKAHFQAGVDAAYQQFTAAVAKGRGVPVADVRGERFGEGRAYNAKDALARGLIDGIATMGEVLAATARGERVTPANGARAWAGEDPAVISARLEHVTMEMTVQLHDPRV